MAVVITQVEPGSLAYKKRICKGQTLLSINGHTIMDVLDYQFYVTHPRLHLVIQDEQGKKRVLSIHKQEDEDIGLGFETYLMDQKHACRNKCIFCFIDQLPPDMRESLYFKDDDSRLSFLFGNYITLTNLTEHEISRIIDMHISPMHISVHTTNPELRCSMMNNRFAGNALSVLKRFADADIRMDCQLVVCPDYNDKEELQHTMEDLANLAPQVQSVAIVPVGLTKYREGLTPLRMFESEEAYALIKQVEDFGDNMLVKHQNRMFYPADELYIKAGLPIPSADFYGEMTQLENGVGMVALLREQFAEAVRSCNQTAAGTPTTIATGVSAAPILRSLVDEAAKKWHNLQVEVVAIRNEFFGETINVAGLITGSDLIKQLHGIARKRVVIPSVMLRRERDRFLDDLTPDDVAGELGVTLEVADTDGDSFLQVLLS